MFFSVGSAFLGIAICAGGGNCSLCQTQMGQQLVFPVNTHREIPQDLWWDMEMNQPKTILRSLSSSFFPGMLEGVSGRSSTKAVQQAGSMKVALRTSCCLWLSLVASWDSPLSWWKVSASDCSWLMLLACHNAIPKFHLLDLGVIQLIQVFTHATPTSSCRGPVLCCNPNRFHCHGVLACALMCV